MKTYKYRKPTVLELDIRKQKLLWLVEYLRDFPNVDSISFPEQMPVAKHPVTKEDFRSYAQPDLMFHVTPADGFAEYGNYIYVHLWESPIKEREQHPLFLPDRKYCERLVYNLNFYMAWSPPIHTHLMLVNIKKVREGNLADVRGYKFIAKALKLRIRDYSLGNLNRKWELQKETIELGKSRLTSENEYRPWCPLNMWVNTMSPFHFRKLQMRGKEDIERVKNRNLSGTEMERCFLDKYRK